MWSIFKRAWSDALVEHMQRHEFSSRLSQDEIADMVVQVLGELLDGHGNVIDGAYKELFR